MAAHLGSQFGLSRCEDTFRNHPASINEWIVDFLLRNENPNLDLAMMLTSKPKVWLPPMAIDVDKLERIAGPGKAFHEDEGEWNARLRQIQETFTNVNELPPIIVFAEHNTDTDCGFLLTIVDGAHRTEALRGIGHTQVWSLVGFDEVDVMTRFLSYAAGTPQ